MYTLLLSDPFYNQIACQMYSNNFHAKIMLHYHIVYKHNKHSYTSVIVNIRQRYLNIFRIDIIEDLSRNNSDNSTCSR